MANYNFTPLIDFLLKVPSVEKGVGSGVHESGKWWVKFSLNIEHQYAWNVVQEIGHVVNYVSINERLPTVFYPVSPPPYMNGGPKEFLSWIIETKDIGFTPDDLKEWLEGRLPNPVDDLDSWNIDEE